ncbi:hypothetical protein OIDMADRAFT_26239 [Oidiodendron maius Zn]|uniref:Heterokaryon incompatibility domain-containing protein n=1 Tax=Oidiodendron maius (strain Zn) TaxID=913774 RepID=A0A0C3DNE2_OIDMZ|nr:hypothetical protein OIDMADRAFT_26239 [Oidiodendron maius Zn]
MGEIHELASVVLIWLGPATSNSKILQWAMTELSDALITAFDGNLQQPSSITSIRDPRLYSLLDIGDAALVYKKIEYFLSFIQSLRYFRRTWVMQEVAVARRFRTFCGPDDLNLATLLDLWSYMNGHGWLSPFSDMYISSIHQIRLLKSSALWFSLDDKNEKSAEVSDDDRQSWQKLKRQLQCFAISFGTLAVSYAWLLKSLYAT